ncbi:M56 family metallopeptidase [Massilibacteroides sp.]|uniref:M56 family metallopeptidase n=1 Tax=Massilibacteroides sp. TaxID=2034766 RepID=UPI00261A623E|nr:M56 family metallopeptidase [Massilibacteroides sp.]MDD4516126.1 M56 family metallopeptidase [Massilibacteroides sp.]
MGYLFVYILKSGFCLVIFYLFYRLLLSEETFYRFNRVVLLGLVLLSFVIPFIQFTTNQPTIIQQQAIDLEALLLMANEVETETPKDFPYVFIFYAYLFGVCCFLWQMLNATRKIKKIIRTGRFIQVEGVSVCIIDNDIAPFSWRRNVIISEKDWTVNGREILAHEKAHIMAGHGWDLAMINACVLFQWFNPAVWLLKKELQALHEYQADKAVLEQGVDAKNYQLLLIKKAVGAHRFISVVNSLNQSSLKNRIIMMLKRKSNPWRRLKFVGVFPLAAIAVATFARPEISEELEKITSVEIAEIVPEVKISQPVIVQVADTVKKKVSKSAEKTVDMDIVSYILNDKPVSSKEIKELDVKDIKKIEVMKEPTPDFLKSKNITEKNGVILVTTRSADASKLSTSFEKEQDEFYKSLNAPLIIVDGKEYDAKGSGMPDPTTIESITILKDEKAMDFYGEKARNGVVLIELKKNK